MSRVYFHTRTHTAELAGSERVWMHWIVENCANPWWGLGGANPIERALDIADMIPERLSGQDFGHIKRDAQLAKRNMESMNIPDRNRMFIHCMSTCLWARDMPLQVGEHVLDSKNVESNTALLVGNDAVRLATKIHGWCEIHPWIEEHDRTWCADIIDSALDSGLYRGGLWTTDADGGRVWVDQGWPDVVRLLRDTTTHPGPVVLSYSVCEEFPNPYVSATMPPWPVGIPDDWDALDQDQRRERESSREAWYDLPAEDRWEAAMTGLRRRRPWANIAPGNLSTTTFGPNVTLIDLFEREKDERDERVRAAFEKDARDEALEATSGPMCCG